VRLTTSLQVGAKYFGCVVCGFHVAAGTGSAPCQKPVSINLQKWFLSPIGRLNFGFILREKLTAVLITPSSWGSQLVRQHYTINKYQVSFEVMLLSNVHHEICLKFLFFLCAPCTSRADFAYVLIDRLPPQD
jgi:hypothetical protein